MRIHDFSHISHILTSTERFMKKLLILLLGLLLLQISYSRSVLIPKNRPELVISKIYNPSSGKILVIYQCKDWLNRVTNSFAAPEFMIRIGSTIMSLSAADYDWTVSTDGSEWVKVTDLNDMPLTAGTKSPYVQQIRITADVNPQTELRPATVTFSSTDQTQTATVSVTQEAAGPAFPCQWIFSASTVGQYNSSWSASNMLPSTSGSSGYISVVRGEANVGREFTRTVNSYRPSVSTMVEGDYWLYTLPVRRLEAGTAVEFDATMAGEANSPKYFIVEYLDGGVWKSVEEDLLTAPEDPSIRYSYKCSGVATGTNYQHASIMQTIRFTDPVEGAVQIRCRAVGPYTCTGGTQDISADDSASQLPQFGFSGSYVQNLGTAVPGDTKKVLCLGNSFSYYSNPAWMLKEIAWNEGTISILRGISKAHKQSTNC